MGGCWRYQDRDDRVRGKTVVSGLGREALGERNIPGKSEKQHVPKIQSLSIAQSIAWLISCKQSIKLVQYLPI